MFVARSWGLLSGPVDCDSLCQREKGVMSMLFPHVAIHLRCRDGDQGENMNQVAYGCTGLVGSSQAIEAAKRSHNETIEDWNMWVTAGDQICGKKCSAAKSSICAAKPELCEQLRCNDLWLGRDEPGRTEQQCKLVSRPQVTRVPTPLLLTHQQMDSRWRAHGIEECGPACQAE